MVAAHGFTYDASVRSFSLKYDNPQAAAGEGWTAPLEEHGLLRLPTTAPLTNIARQRGHPLPVGNLRYELGYIHDYDLSSSAHRTAARVALRRWSDGGVLITASALAQRVGERLAMDEPQDVTRKYDRIAADYSSRYADPGAVSRFYVGLVRDWGGRVPPGASILEIGCADGFMTAALVRAGYVVTGLDIAPRMIEVAAERLERAGMRAEIRALPTSAIGNPMPWWDVVLAPMWTFFHYAERPGAVLARLAPATRHKLLVDLNPREYPIDEAVSWVASSGLEAVGWRPVLIPLSRRIGSAGLAALRAAGRVPPVRDALLRRKFNVVLKGDAPRG